MLTAIIKFLHIIVMLSLCGSLIYGIALASAKKSFQSAKIHRLNRLLVALTLLAVVTGTLLVHPKNFTFHTPWVQMAYLLVGMFLLIVALFLWLARRQVDLGKPYWLLLYCFLGSLLLVAIHDAVTKTPLLS